MSLVELDKAQAIDESISIEINKFLLIETQIIEDDDYGTLDNNADNLPVARDIVEILRDIDLNTTRDWLWEDTFLNDHYERGPLLVEIEKDSPMTPYFWEKVCETDSGVLITSDFDRKLVLQHLKSIMTILLPSGSEAQLKLHAPTKLYGVLEALSDIRLSTLLGPIKNIYWLENCGPVQRYFKVTNPSEHTPRHDVPKWYQFTDEEQKHLNHYDLIHFKRSILNTILSHQDQGNYNNKKLDHLIDLKTDELETIIDKGMQNGEQLGIEAESILKEYIVLNILDPYFFKQDNISGLINNIQISGRERMLRVRQLMDLQG